VKRTPLRRQSAKRRAEAGRRRAAVAAVVDRDGPGCWGAALVPDVACAGPLHAHEVTPRGTHPGSHLDPDCIRLLCRAHHDFAHTAESRYGLGLLQRRTT